MVFLNLYGIPRAPAETGLLPKLQPLVRSIAAWTRTARQPADRTIGKFEDRPLRWADDIRNVRAHS